MENSIYLGLSRQMALKDNLDIVANNIANMNTVGYRNQTLLFKEHLFKDSDNMDDLSFVTDYGQYQSNEPGTMIQTGNDLNVALNGPGFMAVSLPDGSTAWTRNGEFIRGSDGSLQTASGYKVIGNGGPIIIPPDSIEVTIDEKGSISNQNGQFARLQLAEFENIQSLDPVGNNTYKTSASPQPASKTLVQQGFVEGSNVKPVIEINRMVEILREFQNVQRILEAEHERIRNTIQKLTQA